MLPISLGQTCRPRFQILRWIYASRFPDRSIEQFRTDIYVKSPDAHVLPKYPFDWQITAPETVCEWLERDFQGIFELADLEPDEGNRAKHKHFPAFFPHHFHSADLAAEYSEARARIEAVSTRFRALTTAHQPAYVIWAPDVSADTLDRLKRALKRYADGPLFVGPDSHAGKPPEYQWEGDDEAWAEALNSWFGSPAKLLDAL